MPPKRDKTKKDYQTTLNYFNDLCETIEEQFEETPAEGLENPPEATASRPVLSATILRDQLKDLDDRWKAVLSNHLGFLDAYDDAVEDAAAIEGHNTEYKALRKRFSAIKHRVGQALEIQEIGERRPPDITSDIDSATEELSTAKHRIEEELSLLENWISSLPPNQTASTIKNYQSRLDSLAISLEDRLAPSLQPFGEVVPTEKIAKTTEVRQFTKTQQNGILGLLTLLFSKQADFTPTTIPSGGRGPATGAHSGPRLHIEKLKLPTFDGDPTKWILFKAKFRDVMQGAGYDGVALGIMLRDQIPKDSQDRIDHLKTYDEMIVVLNSIYGDPATSVTLIVSKLLNLTITKKAEYDKIIELSSTIKKYTTILRELSTELKSDLTVNVKYNPNLTAHLISLLPPMYRIKWFDYRVSSDPLSNEWTLFSDWIQEMEKRANSEKLAVLSCPDPPKPPTPKPKPAVGSFATGVAGTATVCPLCSVFHSRNGVQTNIIIDCPRWREAATVDDKARIVEAMAGCRRCLRWDHRAGDDCKGPKAFHLVREKILKNGLYTCGKSLTTGSRCASDHSSYLCGTTIEFVGTIRLRLTPESHKRNPSLDRIVLLPIQEIEIKDQIAKLFFDGGSTANLISYALARRLGLVGSAVSYTMQTVDSGGWMTRNGYVYAVPITDRNGEVYYITAYGMDDIAECREDLIIDDNLKKLVPSIPSTVWDRPKGKVDLLIGSCLTKLFPRDHMEIDNLRIKTSLFGTGYVLQGTSQAINPIQHSKARLSSNNIAVRDLVYAPLIQGAQIQCLQVAIAPSSHNLPKQKFPETCIQNHSQPRITSLPHDYISLNNNEEHLNPYAPVFQSTSSKYGLATITEIPEHETCCCTESPMPFLEAEEQGIAPPRRCRRCKSCTKCSDRNQLHNEVENAKLDVIESKVMLDEENEKIYVEYPFKSDPSILGNSRINNFRQSCAIEASVENRQIKNGTVDAYNAEYHKFSDRATIGHITNKQLRGWDGPVNFVSHHEVFKPGSSTTPLRIVSNSALVNRTCGKSLNSLLMKGPNSLNSMITVLLRFRSYIIAMIFDLVKAYNSMITGAIEFFTRLTVWRDCDKTQDWKICGFQRVTYGDLCTSCQLEVAKGKCADARADIDPEAAQRIKEDAFVDDIPTGGTQEQVDRFRGKKLESGEYDGTMPRILAAGGLHIKEILVSGEDNPAARAALGDYVLGIRYDPVRDKFMFQFEIHTAPKVRGVRKVAPITLENVHLLYTLVFTPKMLTGLVNSFFDPMGLMCAWTIKFKLLNKKLNEHYGGRMPWDDTIPEDHKAEWIALIIETLEMGCVEFSRGVKPPNACGPPEIIGFSKRAAIQSTCSQPRPACHPPKGPAPPNQKPADYWTCQTSSIL